MHTRTVPMGYSQKNIPYAPVKELDFTSAKGKKNKIDVALAEASLPIAKRVRKSPSNGISPPDDTEIETFYKMLSAREEVRKRQDLKN